MSKIFAYYGVIRPEKKHEMAADAISRMKSRQPGLYWVKSNGEWTVAEWVLVDYTFQDVHYHYHQWSFIGTDEDEGEELVRQYDTTFEVDERKINR